MEKSITERHSLPSMREIPRSGPAKANDIRFATLRGRNQPPAALKTVPELQAKEAVPNIRGDPVKNPTDSPPLGNLGTNACGRSLLAPPSLSSLRSNSSHSVADYSKNIVSRRASTRYRYGSPKPNSPQTTHEVALQSYRVARQNGSGYVWEWGPNPAATSTGAQIPVDDYDRDTDHSSTINSEPVSQKAFHDTAHASNALNPPPRGSQAIPPYHTDHSRAHGTAWPEAPYPETSHGPTPYSVSSLPPTALSQNHRGISPFRDSRPSTPSTFRLKSIVTKTSQYFGMSNASRSAIALNASAATGIPEVKQPKQYQKDTKDKKTWKTKDDVKVIMVQTQAQMFLEIARQAERRCKTVYFASTTGSTFVLTNDSCAGAYTAISLSTANLAGQIAPSLIGAAELPVDDKKGRKGLLFLLSPQQIMGLLPFEKVDVEKQGKSEMQGFGAKTKLGQQYYEHEWQDEEDRRFTLALHLAMVKVRGPGNLVGEISAVFWA